METALNLDCVPYGVIIEPKHGRATIEVGDSILAELDNRTETTGNRYSENSNQGIVYCADIEGHELDENSKTCSCGSRGKQNLTVVFECDDDGRLLLTVSGFKGDSEHIKNSLITWIDQIWYAAESVGWEALRTQKEIERYF